jgi:hypothetical protein
MKVVQIFQTLNEGFLKPFSEDWFYGHFYHQGSHRGDPDFSGTFDAIVGAGAGYAVGGPYGFFIGLVGGKFLPFFTYNIHKYLVNVRLQEDQSRFV